MGSYPSSTVYPKKYAHGFCFAVLCCGYTLTDFPISIRLTSLALWQSNDCPSARKATLMNMDKYFMWIHYERLHNHNKAKHNKTVCIFLGIYCMPNIFSTVVDGMDKVRLSSNTWVRYPGFSGHEVHAQYRPRWFQDFPAFWLPVARDLMGPIWGSVSCQKKVCV